VTLPFTVVGGFLGAGKTTLVNRVLADAHGQRIAVLVNDFGAIAIDASLIARHDGDTIALTNGCICCAVGGEFAEALPPLLTADPPLDRVLVEASGVADPARIAQYGTLPGFRLDGVIVVVDAASLGQQLAHPAVAPHVEQQLRAAHVVLLSKVDLLSPDDAADARALVAARRPDLAVIEMVDGDVPPAVVLGAHLDRHGALDLGADVHHHFDTRAFEADGEIDRTLFEAHLAALPSGVVRAKGVLRFAGDADPSIVHVVGTRRRITAATTGVGGTLGWVVIGLAGSLGSLTIPAGLRPLPG
jgi:G3E family GTPase